MKIYRGRLKMELNSFQEKEKQIDEIFNNIAFVKIGPKEMQELKEKVEKAIFWPKKRQLLKALEEVTYEYEITTYSDGFGEINYIKESTQKGKVTYQDNKIKCYFWKKLPNQEVLEIASVYEVIIFMGYQKLHKQKVQNESNRDILVKYKNAFALINPKGKVLGYFYPDSYSRIIKKCHKPNYSEYIFKLGSWQEEEEK